MCGIAGFCFTADTCVNARVLSRALLGSIESRGREATGYAAFDVATQTIVSNNAPVKATEFVKMRKEFRLPAESRQVILHTRLATQGTVKNPLNNHPVLAYTEDGQTVAAVHNGSVWNDDVPFDTYGLPRFAQVDSEAIPAMVAAFPTDFYAEIFGELEGGIATGWLDERTPRRLNLVRAWDSPMVVASIDLIDRLGSKVKGIMFASTVAALTAGLTALGLSWDDEGVDQYEIGEGEYLSCTDGEWDGLVYPFRLPEMTSRWGGSWRKGNAATQGYGSGWASGHWSGDDEWGYGSDYAGVGSGKVDSGKPSTYMDLGDGDVARVDPDTLTPVSSEYRDWWEHQASVSDLVDAAERITDDSYVPDSRDMVILSETSQSERAGLGITEGQWRRWGEDYMWHMESCRGGNCRWDDTDCPTVMDRTSVDDLVRMAERWGISV